MNMSLSPVRFALFAAVAAFALSLTSCDRNPFSGSKLTLANYNKITTGMSKTQVEKILGAPTTSETKDMIIFKKTTWRYEDGKNFAMITFKNDEVDGKETNLSSSS
jgi:outer membrane protein assembly factor BamE (lipoprotein component of BamABCDE complex)